MRISSRAIVLQGGKLLAMFRRKIKDGVTKEYYAIPGGGLEEGESLEENVIRELKEEMSVDVKVLGYLGSFSNEKTEQHYFHCEIIAGEVALGGEELERMTEENYYEPRFLDLADLENVSIFGYTKNEKRIFWKKEKCVKLFYFRK